MRLLGRKNEAAIPDQIKVDLFRNLLIRREPDPDDRDVILVLSLQHVLHSTEDRCGQLLIINFFDPDVIVFNHIFLGRTQEIGAEAKS